jgi:hypothetical protein
VSEVEGDLQLTVTGMPLRAPLPPHDRRAYIGDVIGQLAASRQLSGHRR